MERLVAHVVNGVVSDILSYQTKTDNPKYGLVDVTDVLPPVEVGDSYDVYKVIPEYNVVSAARERILKIKEEAAERIESLSWELTRASEQPLAYDIRIPKAKREAIRVASNIAEGEVNKLRDKEGTSPEDITGFTWDIPEYTVPKARQITEVSFYVRLGDKLPVLLKLNADLKAGGDYSLDAEVLKMRASEYINLDDPILRPTLESLTIFSVDELDTLFADGLFHEIPENLK